MNRICVLLGVFVWFAGPALGQAPARRAVPPVPAVPPVVAVPAAPAVAIAVPDVDAVLAMPPITVPIAQQIDIESIKEQEQRIAEQAREIAAQAKEQAFEQQQRAWEDLGTRWFELDSHAFQMQNFALAQGPGPMIMRGRNGGDYNGALSDLERRQYDRAISRLDQVIMQKGAHADGALYWKAYAQYKLGRSEDALATIAELRRSYAQSHYIADARVLEADVRKTSGKPASDSADDDEIKLLALSSMQRTNPQGAVTLLENVLKATNSLQVKKRALFVLAQNDDPAAHQVLLNYAKGNGNPDLQVEAIRYLTARTPRSGNQATARQTTTTELMDIYNSSQDVDVRRAVLSALVSAGDKAGVLKIATSGADLELKRQAISQLGGANLITAPELMQLYQKEENKELKQSMISALGSMGAGDALLQIVKTEKDPTVRVVAIRRLGEAKNASSSQALIDLYSSDQDLEARKAVISALGSQNNADALIAIARKETNSDLKLQLVRRIADMAPHNKAAMDYLMEQIK